ncbi:protein of unknown function [Xenorhabdus poinarii G6]|uniref:Uncharacterized protein n=1 Tax=Xenorhabdus poinarii G6 TaxID=1354304 RepID=A0A068R4S0_9GAMM|nr:protein of unknown function [Xenorhabdus poinarii G6]
MIAVLPVILELLAILYKKYIYLLGKINL